MLDGPSVLDADALTNLAEYEAGGGGRALEAARASEPVAVIDVVESAGLRGRGGAGFPTGVKWRTVADLYDLAFLPLVMEHYDLVVPRIRRDRAPVRRLIDLLSSAIGRDLLRRLGFEPGAPSAT